LDSADDYVRIEIETAFQRNIPVIPVKFEGVSMPDVSELPDTLKELPYLNAVDIRPDADFKTDMEKLIRQLEVLMPESLRQGRS